MAIEEMIGRITVALEHLKQFTATPGEGCTRLPFTPEARQAAEYLKTLMEEAGLDVREDTVGNIFGTLYGSEPDLPCVMMGSHFDSVINGGDFDGVVGILCAIEAARQLKGTEIRRNFVVACFCDEEGVRFGTGYFGSGAMLGNRDVAYCRKFRDMSGTSIYTAMKQYGLKPERIGEAKWPEGSIGCFIEAHIEQGPVLDSGNIEIGLVDCIVGLQRYVIAVHGRADHAGTTPMDMRMDAVEVATKVICKIPDWAREKADGTVATIGYVNAVPGGMNIVAEKCEFTVDIRSRNSRNIEDIVCRICAALNRETAKICGSYEMDDKLNIAPVDLSKDLLHDMEEICQQRGYSYRYVSSGAGHDSLEIGQKIPTAMLFIPSIGGRSHCPAEFTRYSDIAKAAVVMGDLAQKLLRE